MADVTSVVTVDANEWVYIDSLGDPHTVTTSQTFNLSISDDGAAAVQYSIPTGESVTTTDGLTLHFRPRVGINNLKAQTHELTDAGQGTAFISPVINGEIDIECPVTGKIQHWKIATITPSDADFGAAGTIAATFEDQFGNTMSWVAGMTVAQAA